MKAIIIKYLALFCILLPAACIVAAPTDGDQTTKSYPATGVVEKIAPDLRHVTIHHQAIPNYMMEMTMDFSVKNTNELSGISIGDKIKFTLVVGDNVEWVENIKRIGHSNKPMDGTMPMKMTMSQGVGMPELKPGDTLTDYALTAEDGRQIHLSDFRGKAVAFTFFFTRCPLPDYCPRLNNNFEQTRKILSSDPGAPANWQFISISFDPGFDTPDVLENYAGVYRGEDTNRWLFASASTSVLADAALRLDLMVLRQGNSFMHNLRTVVLDTQGHIYKQFDDNQWTPQQLADTMMQAARLPETK